MLQIFQRLPEKYLYQNVILDFQFLSYKPLSSRRKDLQCSQYLELNHNCALENPGSVAGK